MPRCGPAVRRRRPPGSRVAGFTVIFHQMTVAQVVVGRAATTVSGDYVQVVTPPDGRRMTVSGTFQAAFRVADGGRVLLAKMHTESK
jgi:hypothetical protein